MVPTSSTNRAGRPITITHPEVRVIHDDPESVQWSCRRQRSAGEGRHSRSTWGAAGCGLAEDLVPSGFEPGHDIEIQLPECGPREAVREVFFDAASASPPRSEGATSRNTALTFGLHAAVDALESLARAGASRDRIRRGLQQIVPDYVLPNAGTGSTMTPLRGMAAAAP